MTRVLHIISDTNIGGGGRALLNYLQFADREKFELAVVLPEGSALKPRIENLKIPLSEIPALADKSMDRKAIPLLRKRIRAFQPHIVHTHGALAGRIAARLEGKKAVYTKHCAFPPGKLLSSPPGRLLNGLLDGLLADAVIAVGPSAQEILVASGIPKRRIHQMLNGVAPLPAPPEDCRSQWGLRPEDFVVGILARVEPYKGHDVLLQAAGLLEQRGRAVKILIAGDGSEAEELRRQAKSMFSGSVIFGGFVTRVEEALGAMDVQVNASTISETSSLSLLEGMSIGLPAIASDCGGNPSLIFPGENGFLFENGSAADLAGKLETLMDRPELRARMSRRAKEIFEKKFTGQVYARNVESVYRTIRKGAS